MPVSILLALAGLAWGFGTPVLWFGAVATGISFGEPPTPAEQQAVTRLLLWAMACGFLVPWAGLVLALTTRRRAAAALLAVALALSVVAAAATGTLSRDNARWVRDQLNPPEATTDRWPPTCQEHSGGANTCPGGYAAMNEPRPEGGRRGTVVLNLLELAWVLGTPVLFGAGIGFGVGWFEDAPPSPGAVAAARWLLWAAIACAVLAPAAGVAVAVAAGRRARAVVLAAALVIGIPFAGAIWLWIPR